MTTWFTMAGILLLMLGFTLRTILMMRSSDATPREVPVPYGRELLFQYRQLFPHSAAPWVTQSALIGGVLLLLAGIGAQISR
ncbi:MAG: hypothetical protein ABSD98_04395 [Candidatus Korobacteraceae bacterium]